MTNATETAEPWDRECVVCATKWLEKEEGPDCPACEDKKYLRSRMQWKGGRYVSGE